MFHIPDLVRDSRLETKVGSKYTRHQFYESDEVRGERAVLRQEKWERQERIGGGSFGIVWKERCVKGEKDYNLRAVKEIQKPTSSYEQVNYYHELEAIAKFSHQRYVRCFVKSFGWYEHKNTICITMEYFPKGDLQAYLSGSPSLPEPEAQIVVCQLLDGLNSLHDNGFAHRDLKPANILIKRHPPEQWWVKISDFGVSKRVEMAPQSYSSVKGTLPYMAPELHGFVDSAVCFSNDKQAAACATDMWALGEIAYQMLTKKHSFINSGALFAFIRDPSRFPFHHLQERDISTSCMDLVNALLKSGPIYRMRVREALKHSWTASNSLPTDKPPSIASIESSDSGEDASTAGQEQNSDPSGRWSPVSMVEEHLTTQYGPEPKDDDHYENQTPAEPTLDKQGTLPVIYSKVTGVDEEKWNTYNGRFRSISPVSSATRRKQYENGPPNFKVSEDLDEESAKTFNALTRGKERMAGGDVGSAESRAIIANLPLNSTSLGLLDKSSKSSPLSSPALQEPAQRTTSPPNPNLPSFPEQPAQADQNATRTAMSQHAEHTVQAIHVSSTKASRIQKRAFDQARDLSERYASLRQAGFWNSVIEDPVLNYNPEDGTISEGEAIRRQRDSGNIGDGESVSHESSTSNSQSVFTAPMLMTLKPRNKNEEQIQDSFTHNSNITHTAAGLSQEESETSGQEWKRRKLILEIIGTERNFIGQLEYLRDSWIRPLLGDVQSIHSPISINYRGEFVRSVFGNVEEVLEVNSRFCEALCKRYKEQYPVRNIGDIFLEFLPQFDTFVRYGANQLYGQDHFRREQDRNLEFHHFVNETERLFEAKKVGIDSYLTAPTTRLCRYPLLLDTLLKHTPSGNPDNKDIPQAIRLIKDLMSRISVESARAENRLKLLQLHYELDWNTRENVGLGLMKDNRVLLMKTSFRITCKDTAEVQVYLFDHAVLICRVTALNKGEELKAYRQPISLENLVVSASGEVVSQPEMSKRIWSSLTKTKHKLFTSGQLLYVISFKISRIEAFDLYATSTAQRTKFMQAVRKQQTKLANAAVVT